jgi:hypothetical protein
VKEKIDELVLTGICWMRRFQNTKNWFSKLLKLSINRFLPLPTTLFWGPFRPSRTGPSAWCICFHYELLVLNDSMTAEVLH